jgi:hypothetical protein
LALDSSLVSSYFSVKSVTVDGQGTLMIIGGKYAAFAILYSIGNLTSLGRCANLRKGRI